MARVLVFVIISSLFLQSMNFLFVCKFFNEAKWYPMGFVIRLCSKENAEVQKGLASLVCMDFK